MHPAVLAHGTASLSGEGISPLALHLLLGAGAVIATVALRARGLRTVGGEAVAPQTIDLVADGRWPGDARPRAVRRTLQAVGLGGLGLLLAVGWVGSELPGASPLPLVLLAVGWWLVPVLSWAFGDWYRLIDPFDALAAVVRRGEDPPTAPTEEADDWWVPAVLLASFAWMIICWPDGLRPRVMGAWLTALTVVMVGGALVAGRAWVRRSSPLAVLAGAMAAAAPLDWRDGRVRFCSPLAGLASRAGGRRSLAVLVTVLGATVWEATASTRWWADIAGADDSARATLWSTVGLLWAIVLVAVVWTGTARLAELVGTRRGAPERQEPLVTDLALVLGPLVAATTLAHQLGLLVLYVQDLVILGLDPFARGWDLFGSFDWRTSDQPLTPTTIGWIGVVVVTAALGVGLVGAWDRLVARLEGAAIDAIWPLCGWTVLSASTSIWALIG